MTQRNHLSLAETLLSQPLGDDPEHVRIVADRINQEPDADTLRNMMGIS